MLVIDSLSLNVKSFFFNTMKVNVTGTNLMFFFLSKESHTSLDIHESKYMFIF